VLQVEVCFLSLPPGFPAVPQYFNHTPVGPGASQPHDLGAKNDDLKGLRSKSTHPNEEVNFQIANHIGKELGERPFL
jgi:hypothetical protein